MKYARKAMKLQNCNQKRRKKKRKRFRRFSLFQPEKDSSVSSALVDQSNVQDSLKKLLRIHKKETNFGMYFLVKFFFLVHFFPFFINNFNIAEAK